MSKFWVAGLAVLLFAGTARADEFVRSDCRGLVSASDGLSYERPEHTVWYRRFWTGRLDTLEQLLRAEDAATLPPKKGE